MTTNRWLDTGTDDCHVFDVEAEAKAYSNHLRERGFDPYPPIYKPNGSIIIKCENQRDIRFVKRRLTTITVTVSGGNRLERHL